MENARGRFYWYELLTTDPKAAEAFYKEVVGWTPKEWKEGSGYTLWMNGENAAGGMMKLTEEQLKMGTPPCWSAYVVLPNLEKEVERIENLGGATLVAPMAVDEIGTFGVFRDPQGAVFCAISPETVGECEKQPSVGEFSWNELMTSDSEAAVSFYKALFGWEISQEMDMGDGWMYRIFRRPGMAFDLGGIYNHPPERPVSAWLYYISTSDLEGSLKAVTRLGGKVMFGPMEVPGGDRIAQCQDPQGVIFALHTKGAGSSKG